MINRDALRILARQDTLTEKEWKDLVAARAKMVSKHMRNMTLLKIKELKFWRPTSYVDSSDPGTYYSFDQGEVNLVSQNFNLETMGIFPETNKTIDGSVCEVVFGTESRFKFWGFTRNDEWLLISISKKITTQHKRRGHLFDFEVCIKEATLDEVCEIPDCTPMSILRRLHKATADWVSLQESRLDMARRLHESVMAEYYLLTLIQENVEQ